MAKWIVCVVLGLLCVVAGAVGQNEYTGEVSCGGETMRPGDICEETRNGVTDTLTYDEMVEDEKAAEAAYDTWGRWVVLAAGIALLGLGITGIVKRKRSGAPTAAPMQPAPQGYPPMQPGQPMAHQPPPYQPGPPAPHQNYPQQPGGFGPQGGNQGYGPQG